MDWMQFATFMLGNMIFTLTLWLWNRSESREDMSQIREDNKQATAKMESFRAECLLLIRAIQDEIKDFHGRLCTIEERNKDHK